MKPGRFVGPIATEEDALTTVGALEAREHLGALLDRVAHGEEIVITRHGRPVARLVPATPDNAVSADVDIEALLALRDDGQLRGLDWRELRDAGRR